MTGMNKLLQEKTYIKKNEVYKESLPSKIFFSETLEKMLNMLEKIFDKSLNRILPKIFTNINYHYYNEKRIRSNENKNRKL